MSLRQAAQQALEALEANLCKWDEKTKAITSLRAALAEPPCKTGASCTNKCQRCAEPEQEPDDLTIAYMSGVYDGKKQRKPLTDDEIAIISVECAATHKHDDLAFARAIERAHGIKEQEHE